MLVVIISLIYPVLLLAGLFILKRLKKKSMGLNLSFNEKILKTAGECFGEGRL